LRNSGESPFNVQSVRVHDLESHLKIGNFGTTLVDEGHGLRTLGKIERLGVLNLVVVCFFITEVDILTLNTEVDLSELEEGNMITWGSRLGSDGKSLLGIIILDGHILGFEVSADEASEVDVLKISSVEDNQLFEVLVLLSSVGSVNVLLLKRVSLETDIIVFVLVLVDFVS
jgi:hypothetical protein